MKVFIVILAAITYPILLVLCILLWLLCVALAISASATAHNDDVPDFYHMNYFKIYNWYKFKWLSIKNTVTKFISEEFE